ncbi:hypothetical protein GUITHDRAFT_151152 [Guillardia theta CCMP2712]|uniref:Uncharacterized protein n=1 Tax=Guillardia theta (strain CCMP2712) TaxID=905079 RepID=L1JQ91_GUITC|nr:hypothetical protein GUITHDRAFT_151152 [Guillardia theta CCMP2712]EKX50444.1 hypothetical protein GUITHDRAFT_151152 [Guillardia theta CCMP2712]|eukprot:XP_005837424.1 hypothetical protein GUITHDRAFT_151152 [Guillardia theta CCMP2712]
MLKGDRNSPITMIFQRTVGQSQDQVVVTILRAVLSGAPSSSEGVASPSVRSSPPAPSSSQNDNETIKNLKKQFSGLSFIWGDAVHDSVEESMKEWRADMIFGPKKNISSTAEAPQENSVVGRSFNHLPPSITPQVPMFRSYDNMTPTYARSYQTYNFQPAAADSYRMSMMSPMPAASYASSYRGTPTYSSFVSNYASMPQIAPLGKNDFVC